MSNSNMVVSQVGINLIKKWEGVRLTAYQDSGGVWTIGYGHTQGVYQGMTITQAQAENYLKQDIQSHVAYMKNVVKAALNQNQFDALASFHFNVGAYVLQNNTTLLSYLNNRQWQNAVSEMKKYIKVGNVVNQGLVNRRNDEGNLFLKAPAPIENTRTKHNVVTFWYPANSYGANRVIDYCKSKNHKYKIITGTDGRWMISVGTFFQNSRYKFALEKFLAENSMNYTVELAGSGTALKEGEVKVASSENRHSVATYWYSKDSSAYNKVVTYCKDKGWNYKVHTGADGRVKITIGTFLQISDNKFDLMIFLGDANFSFVLELSQYK